MRVMVLMLALVVAALGAVPQAALCIAEHHESHVVFGHAHDHHLDGDAIPHDDDEPFLCGHEIDHESCGDGGCLDVSLGIEGIPSDHGLVVVATPGLAFDVFAPELPLALNPRCVGERPPRPIDDICLGTCRFLI